MACLTALAALLGAGSSSADHVFGPASAHVGAVGARGRILFAGDATGDGLNDVAWQLGTSLRVLVGQGDGTFFPPFDVPTGLATSADDAAAADLDGDGRLDTVHLAADGSAWAVLFNPGGAVTVQTGSLPAGAGTVPLLGDADGDGDLDLWVAGRGVTLLLNQGGSFGAVASHLPGATVVGRAFLAVGDVSGDSRADLIVAPLDGRGSGVDVVRAGTDPVSGQPGIAGVTPVDTGLEAPALAATADVDGDGQLDVVVNGRRSADGAGATRVLRQAAGGLVAAPMAVAQDRTSGGTADIRTADFDRDGDLDVLVACDDHPDCRSLLLHRGNGAGGLGTAEPAGVLLPADRIEVVDLDCDGTPDVVGGAFGLATLLNNGDGTFLDEQAQGLTGADFALSSWNADGQPDVAGISTVGVLTALGHACAAPEPICRTPPPTAVAGDDVLACATAFEPVRVPVSAGRSIAVGGPIGRYCWTTDLGSFVETGLPFFCSPRSNATLELPGGTGGRVASLEVEITSFDGCRDTDDLVVTVETEPVITLAAANPDLACPGEPIELLGRATDTFSPTNLVTLSWDFDIATNSDGLARADDDVDALLVAVSGALTVATAPDLPPGLRVARVTVSGGSSPGCTVTADVPYRVIAPPVVGAIQVSGGSSCANQPFTFRANVLGGEPPVILAWDFDTSVDADGNGDPADDIEALGGEVSWTFGGPGDYTVRASAIDVNACPVWRERTITALPAPEASHVSTSPVCGTLVVSFEDTSTGAPPLTVNWDFGDGSPAFVGRTPTHVYPRPGTYTLTQRVVDSRGCSTTNIGRVLVGTGQVALVRQAVVDGQSGTGTSGNGNGFAEPGERIKLIFELENRGTETVSDVEVSVGVVSPVLGVTVHRATATAPALNPGERRPTQEPQVELELSSGYPCGTPLVLDVTAKAFRSEGCATTKQVALPTGLPTLARLGSALRATTTPGASERPASVWTGTIHATVFSDSSSGRPQVRLVRHAPAGVLIEPSRELSSVAASQLAPRIAWSPASQELGAVWLETTDSASTVAFARLGAAGQVLGNTRRFSVRTQAGEPDVAWTGSSWVVAWPEQQGGTTAINARLVNASGTAVGPLQLLSEEADVGVAHHPAVRLAATGATWLALFPRTVGAATTLRAHVFAASALHELLPLWSTDLGATRAVAPAAGGLTSSFIAAHETPEGLVEGVALGAGGGVLGRTVLGPGAGVAAVGAAGFGVVGRQAGGEVVARGLDRNGRAFGGDLNVSTESGDSRSPGLSADADGLVLVVWADERPVTGGVSEIYSRLIQPVGGGGCSTSTLGDLAPLPNGDGLVTVGDVVVALRIAVGLEPVTPELLARGDVAPGVRTGSVHRVVGDGVIDIGDVVVLLQAAVGQLTLTR